MKNLVFGTYNLEYGGIDNGDISRLERQLGMLAEVNADVWALQECSSWQADGGRILYLVEKLLGMRGFMARSARHPGGDLGVFIREASGIRVIETRHEEKPPYWHGVACLYAEVEGFGPLRFASAHLAPSSPSLRVVEAEAFQLVAEKPVPLIAGGDWNSVPLGGPEPDTTGIHPGKARRKLDFRAAEALSEYMTDIAVITGNDEPTVGHRREDKLGYRCDRVYTTLPPASINGYRVIKEDYPESDHRAVMANLRLGG
jgi:endonuclease/exonuclease/phosphatase family metal-dependent hydrolase